MTDLKRNEVLSFDDGLLTVKMEGHGRANGWGVLAFHERQIEVDADGYHSVEIPPTELRELHAFLGRVLALSAAPGEPCAVKPLVWRDHRPDSFPEPAWSAQTPFGFYNIEEVCASDSPAYVVWLHAHHFIADKDGLDEAKAAAQADYEQRIRSALVTTPQPAAGWDEETTRKVKWWLDEINDCVDRMRNGGEAKYYGQIAKGVDELRALLRREAPAPAEGVEKARWEVGKNGWDASNEITRKDI